MTTFTTDQEAFWAGEFGSAYAERTTSTSHQGRRLALFARILARSHGIRSVLELGANRGHNLAALRTLLPDAELTGVEINADAFKALQAIQGVEAQHSSILDYKPRRKWDLCLTRGVLIHINPDRLNDVYDLMYRCSSRYICIAEYYNPVPVAVDYRGHADRLFKRDFAGEFMDRFPGVSLIDYGFVYHRDPNFPQDDLTWFVLKKPTTAD